MEMFRENGLKTFLCYSANRQTDRQRARRRLDYLLGASHKADLCLTSADIIISIFSDAVALLAGQRTWIHMSRVRVLDRHHCVVALC